MIKCEKKCEVKYRRSPGCEIMYVNLNGTPVKVLLVLFPVRH